MALPTSVTLPRKADHFCSSLKDGSSQSMRSQSQDLGHHSSRTLHSSQNLSPHKCEHKSHHTSANMLPPAAQQDHKRGHKQRKSHMDEIFSPPVFDWWIRRSTR
ncbi:uncharacterized protein [Periplaneta americana]|uniref:uncharacterized protein n=1 Tax=Periplaneta americana TaxID=6978 RepID=UPI0037E8364E